MPVDYTAYLLSSSPPGFEYSSFHTHFGNRGFSPATHQQKPLILSCRSQSVHSWNTGFSVPDGETLPSAEKDGKKTTVTADDAAGVEGASSEPASPVEEPVGPRLPTISAKTGKPKKIVTFADHRGKPLCDIRIMAESSDQPPRVRPELLASLTLGATAGVSETPPFELNFSQPASNYLPFREKIEHNLVSLENVILKDYSMMGTVKVKNISFEKSVFLKITFDSWETSSEVHTNYVSCGRDGSNMYDTFSFESEIPTNTDISKKIQFCVCYRANGGEYWDNNNGKNYEILSQEWKQRQQRVFSHSNGQSNWTTFQSWKNTDKSIPYW